MMGDLTSDKLQTALLQHEAAFKGANNNAMQMETLLYTSPSGI
jgi:hypothetical protein